MLEGHCIVPFALSESQRPLEGQEQSLRIPFSCQDTVQSYPLRTVTDSMHRIDRIAVVMNVIPV